MQALLSQGRIDEALAYAEASRGLNQPNTIIDAACEKILLDAGRTGEAYRKYALTANASSTGLATFRSIVKKYPGCDPKKVLLELAASSGDPGRWFAAAKDAGFLDLALAFANTGRTDPRTLIRAARPAEKGCPVLPGSRPVSHPANPRGIRLRVDRCRSAGCLRPLHGCGADARIAAQARADVLAIATRQPAAAFSDILIRRCSFDPQASGILAKSVTEQKNTTTRSPVRRRAAAPRGKEPWPR
jgi:hypothetical protein